MSRLARPLLIPFIFLLLLGVAGAGEIVRAADGDTAPYAGRFATIVIPYTQYSWWLIRWADNSPVCTVLTEGEAWPTGEQVQAQCGQAVYEQWVSTPACDGASEGETALCAGLYLFQLSNEPVEKTIVVELPPAQVWVSLEGCVPTIPENLCAEIPSLLLAAEEPLPNEHITAVHALMDGQAFDCAGESCEIPLAATPMGGITVEFWADSSFGDASEHFFAQVRVVDSGVSPSPVGGGWYVDVLSSQWRGAQVASCATTWGTFLPVGGPPAWLSSPEVPELLASDEAYYFLAGRLIAQNQVDAADCDGGGMLENGYANACGLEQALPLVQEWQNRFDASIIAAAQETGVPAQLLKNLFAQESQFWPGVFKDPKEFGLGQITENGAETVLLWNPDFFGQFCPLVLDEAACQYGYNYLSEEERATVRGALALQAKADCEDCLTGIDLAHADFSVLLFAETIRANCAQVWQIAHNATQKSAGEVSTYEDLWKMTLANYHAGPGCVSYAAYQAWARDAELDWESVSKYFTPACQGVVSYVEKIAK